MNESVKELKSERKLSGTEKKKKLLKSLIRILISRVNYIGGQECKRNDLENQEDGHSFRRVIIYAIRLMT